MVMRLPAAFTFVKLLGVEPEVGAEIELTYTVGALSEIPYEKTDTFKLPFPFLLRILR